MKLLNNNNNNVQENFLNAGFWQDLSTIMQDFFRPILRLKTCSSQG